MFDIDKYLDDIRISELSPTEDLLTRTKRRCEETEAKKKKRAVLTGRIKKAALIALPAAAVLAVGIFIGARFFAVQSTTPAAMAYYTVDINPSLCVHVDADNKVTGLLGQNDDAQTLLDSLNCVGKPITEAIRQIISAAQEAGYFSEGQRYVLVGCFAADGTAAQGALGNLQAQLESDFGDMINLLIVSGTLEDKQMADSLRVSAGLLKLSQLAEGVEVSDTDKVEDILGEVAEINQKNYCAPALRVSGNEQSLAFTWNELDFDEIGYTGKVKYHIVIADTGDDIAEMNGRTLETVSFNTCGEQTTSMKLALEPYGLKPGDSKYFGIYAEYNGVTVACSPVHFTVPAAQPSPTPSSLTSDRPEPTATPAAPAAYTVSGHVSGQYVILSWGKETRADLAGYKVVASRTNSSPSYPSDGYLKFITNADTTSIKLYEGYGGLKGDTSYYFSVTYLYNDGSTVAANAVRLKVPAKVDGEQEPTSGSYASTDISGYISDDGKIHLSWKEVSGSGFDGYKVMYSFSDSTPVYGEDGCAYYGFYTDPSTTSCSFYPSKICAKAGQKVYFSITVLYDDHCVKKPGKSISLVMPGTSGPEEPYLSTNISGYISEDGKIHLSWGEVCHSGFEGYKVVYSFTDSSPVYGEGGCDYVYWITDSSDTSCSFPPSKIGASPGQTVYFSITVLYEGHSVKKAGDSVTLTMPAAPETTPSPTPECTPDESSSCES